MGERRGSVGQVASLTKAITRLETIGHNQDSAAVLGGEVVLLFEEA